LLTFALLTGYFDLALEIAETYGGEENEKLALVARRIAEADSHAIMRFAETAMEDARGDPQRAVIALGKFADRWRDSFDFGDQA